jgi:5-methylcytosine-specific restriction endonuclease McrA
MAYISAQLRQLVAERAHHRCEYCQSPELITGGPLHVEHVFPEGLGGSTIFDNLALACARCNLHKGTRTRYRDPISGRTALLIRASKNGQDTLLGVKMAHGFLGALNQGGRQSQRSI